MLTPWYVIVLWGALEEEEGDGEPVEEQHAHAHDPQEPLPHPPHKVWFADVAKNLRNDRS